MTSIVFFGTGPVAAASLAFLRSKYNIEAVITKPRATSFKGETPVETLANTNDIPTYFVTKRSELDELFDNNQFTSQVGIVVDFGIIMSKAVIDSFPMGIINSHYSLLPRWRGADPISYTVLAGDTKAGVSLMVIDEGLDTGKLITSKSIAVDTRETTGSLTKKLIALSNQLFADYLPRYLSGEITPKNQPHPDRATFSHKLHKADSVIDWHEPAITIERKIRAYQPWPQSRATLGSVEAIITAADIVTGREPATPGSIITEKSRLLVATRDNWLAITSLKPTGKKEMPIQAFLAGYRHSLGA